MRKNLLAIVFLFLGLQLEAQGLFQRVKDKVTDRVNHKEDQAIDQGLDKAGQKPKQHSTVSRQDTAITGNIKVYQNYDFIPGDQILFSDDFQGDTDGEFPPHWALLNGQGTLNKTAGYEALVFTDGNYAKAAPRMKTKNYLPVAFTLEFDMYFAAGAYPIMVFFKKAPDDGGDQNAYVQVNGTEVQYDVADDNFQLQSNLPAAIAGDAFAGSWHHIAMAMKDKQLKIYVDQFRALTVPDTHIIPASAQFGGLATQEAPLVIKNVKIAAGGGMNMLGKKFTDARIVTHGINFDTGKSAIRPESMGVLNSIKAILNDNPDLKFEIDGHTDNTGGSAQNLTLSQQRAEAVKAQLVSMGISASRLTTKGFGDTKPMSDNTTPEGKANNRRVEFIRL